MNIDNLMLIATMASNADLCQDESNIKILATAVLERLKDQDVAIGLLAKICIEKPEDVSLYDMQRLGVVLIELLPIDTSKEIQAARKILNDLMMREEKAKLVLNDIVKARKKAEAILRIHENC